MPTLVRIWDLPTRVFHWALVTGTIALVLTGQLGYMEWHFRLGYTVWTLLMFRLVWGFIGGHWSRFASFCYGPSALRSYLHAPDREPMHAAGHTPPGSLAVYAMLAVLLAQVGTGLFSDDEIAATGPFAHWVSSEFVATATWYHHSVGKLLLIGLVLLHVTAILYYLLRRKRNLVRPMFTGDKWLDAPLQDARDTAVRRGVALFVLLGAAGLVTLLLRFGGPS